MCNMFFSVLSNVLNLLSVVALSHCDTDGVVAEEVGKEWVAAVNGKSSISVTNPVCPLIYNRPI